MHLATQDAHLLNYLFVFTLFFCCLFVSTLCCCCFHCFFLLFACLELFFVVLFYFLSFCLSDSKDFLQHHSLIWYHNVQYFNIRCPSLSLCLLISRIINLYNKVLCVCLSILQFVSPSICLSIYLSVYLSVNLSIFLLSLTLKITDFYGIKTHSHTVVCLSICLSALSLPLYLYVSLFRENDS